MCQEGVCLGDWSRSLLELCSQLHLFFFFFNPVLSEKHDSQNFTNAVAMLACEASHAVEVAGHAG